MTRPYFTCPKCKSGYAFQLAVVYDKDIRKDMPFAVCFNCEIIWQTPEPKNLLQVTTLNLGKEKKQ